MNREPGLIEPLALQVDPRHGDENGTVEAGMPLVFNEAGIEINVDSHRNKRVGTEWSEVHVKSFMLRHQSMLGISAQDADILRTLLQRDISDLNRVMQQQPEKYFKPINLPSGVSGLGD